MDMFMLRILKLEIIKLFWRYKNVRSNCYSFHFRRKRNKTEINICHCDTDLKSEDLKCLFTVATDDTLKKIVESFNKYYKKFEINTCIRMCHFLAQIREEARPSLSISQGEDLTYSVEALKSMFSYFKKHPDEADLYGYK